ncbi:hypothetical protein [Lactobacillus phage Lbab1]|nr:hypothetical protein [Lactobacillus phage Lbab1]
MNKKLDKCVDYGYTGNIVKEKTRSLGGHIS